MKIKNFFARIKNSIIKKKKNTAKRRIDSLPQDMIVEIVTCLASHSSKPLQDVKNLRESCKMFYMASKARKVGKSMSVIKEWDKHWLNKQEYFDFLWHCERSDNLQARFILGMEDIYNQGQIVSGLHHLYKAMMRGDRTATYALGIHLFHNPSSRSLGIEILNSASCDGDVLSKENAATECTVSGNHLIEKCREETKDVLYNISFNRLPVEPRPQCKNRFCGRVLMGSDQWVAKDKLRRSFCSEICRWRDEYYMFFATI